MYGQLMTSKEEREDGGNGNAASTMSPLRVWHSNPQAHHENHRSLPLFANGFVTAALISRAVRVNNKRRQRRQISGANAVHSVQVATVNHVLNISISELRQ